MSDLALYYAYSQDKTKGGTEKHVLTTLAWNADDDCKCWPSYDDLAQACGYSKRAVIRTVKRLEERGLIHKERRNRKDGRNESNCFTILVPEEWAKVYHAHCIEKG